MQLTYQQLFRLVKRVEVLERMKGLLLLPALEMATLKQVATFYDVSEDVIKFLVHNHKDEIISDGFVTYRKDEVIDSLKVDVLSFTNW